MRIVIREFSLMFFIDEVNRRGNVGLRVGMERNGLYGILYVFIRSRNMDMKLPACDIEVESLVLRLST